MLTEYIQVFEEAVAADDFGFVASDSTTRSGGASSSFTIPGSPQAGDLVTISSQCGNVSDPGYNLVSTGGYTQLFSLQHSAQWNSFHYKILAEGETTVTLKGASDTTAFMVQVHRGIDPVTPLDNSYTAVGSGSGGGDEGTPDPGSHTTVTAPCLRLIMANLDNDGVTFDAPTHFSHIASQSSTDGTTSQCSRISVAAAAENPGPYGTTLDHWYTAHMAFRIVGDLWITSDDFAFVDENATLSHSLTASKAVSWTIVDGPDQAQFELSGSTLRWLSNGTKDYEIPDDANDDNIYHVVVRATDGNGLSQDQSIEVVVEDVEDSFNPYSFVGGTGATRAAGAGASNTTLPGTVQEGDLVIVVCTTDDVSDPGSNEFVASSGYTKRYQSQSNAARVACYFKIIGSGETTVSLRNAQSTAAAFVIQVHRGMCPTQSQVLNNGHNATTGGTGNPNPPAHNIVTGPTDTTGYLRVLVGHLDDDNVALTVVSGYANNNSQGVTGASTGMCSKVTASTGSEDPGAFGGSGSDDWTGTHMAFNIFGALP